MKKGFRICQSCKNEIKEESMKCEYCGEIQERPKCKFFGEIEYRGQRQDIYCPICGYIGSPKEGRKYNAFVRVAVFIVLIILGFGVLGWGLYDSRKEDRDSLCKCPQCGNSHLGTNIKTENGKGWWKSCCLFLIGLWIIGILYSLIFKGSGRSSMLE